MDIHKKRRIGVWLISIVLILITLGIINFLYNLYEVPALILMVVVGFGGFVAMYLITPVYHATKEEAAQYFDELVRKYEADDYVVSSSTPIITPYLN